MANLVFSMLGVFVLIEAYVFILRRSVPGRPETELGKKPRPSNRKFTAVWSVVWAGMLVATGFGYWLTSERAPGLSLVLFVVSVVEGLLLVIGLLVLMLTRIAEIWTLSEQLNKIEREARRKVAKAPPYSGPGGTDTG